MASVALSAVDRLAANNADSSKGLWLPLGCGHPCWWPTLPNFTSPSSPSSFAV